MEGLEEVILELQRLIALLAARIEYLESLE